VEWIDLEQESYHKREVVTGERRKWDYTFELIGEEEREKNMKIWNEKLSLEKEKNDQEEKDLREAVQGRESSIFLQGRRWEWKKMPTSGRESTPVRLSRVMSSTLMPWNLAL
jgi:hypothetical protein